MRPPTLPTIPPANNQGPVTPLGRQSPFIQHLTICQRTRSASVTGTRHNPFRQPVHNQAHSGYGRDRSFKPASRSSAPAYLLPISNDSPQSMPPSLHDGSLSMLHISLAALPRCYPSAMPPFLNAPPPTLPTIPPANNQGPVTPLGKQSPFIQHLTICHRTRSASVTGTRHNPFRQSVHNQAHSDYGRDRSFKPASRSPAPAN